MKARPINHFVKLLSVSLFQIMEEGETLLQHNKPDTVIPSTIKAQARDTQRWLALLPSLDPNMPKEIFSAILTKSKAITSSNVETMLNATALTLMLLDDHYHIFSLEITKPDTTFIPIKQLQNIKPDMNFTKPTLV